MLESFCNLLIGIGASVIGTYICKWLDDLKQGQLSMKESREGGTLPGFPLCWNFANLLGYGYYTTPIVVYASGEQNIICKNSLPSGLEKLFWTGYNENKKQGKTH